MNFDPSLTDLPKALQYSQRALTVMNQRNTPDASVLDTSGEALVVSQFTLIADTGRGRGARPDFTGAASRTAAEPVYEEFCAALRATGVAQVETGVFGARMSLDLVNDGPVTIVLDS